MRHSCPCLQLFFLNFALGGGTDINPLSAKPHKRVKHTQTIRRQQPTTSLRVFNHFVRLAFKALMFQS